jgi:hypothetical protein
VYGLLDVVVDGQLAAARAVKGPAEAAGQAVGVGGMNDAPADRRRFSRSGTKGR